LGRREQGVTEKDRELERKAFLRLGCECNNIKHSRLCLTQLSSQSILKLRRKQRNKIINIYVN